LLLAALNRHESFLFKCSGIRLLGEPRRCKYYAHAPRHITGTLQMLCLHTLLYITYQSLLISDDTKSEMAY